MSLDSPAVSAFMTVLPEEDLDSVAYRQAYCIGGLPKVDRGSLVGIAAKHVFLTGAPLTSSSFSIASAFVGSIANSSPYPMDVLMRVSHNLIGRWSGITTPATQISNQVYTTFGLVRKRTVGAGVPGATTAADVSLAFALGRYARGSASIRSLSDSSGNSNACAAKLVALPTLDAGFAYDFWVSGAGFQSVAGGGTGTITEVNSYLFAHGVAHGV